MTQRTPTMRELFNVYARLWIDTKLVVSLIREACLTNIFPANLVRSDELDCQCLAVAINTPLGIQYAIFQKDCNAEIWSCLNMSTIALPTAELVNYAKFASRYLPIYFKAPEATNKAAWEIYISNYPALTNLMMPLISDPNIQIYPWVFNSPNAENPTEFILEQAGGHSIRVWPQNGGVPRVYYAYLPRMTPMSLEDLRAFALS